MVNESIYKPRFDFEGYSSGADVLSNSLTQTWTEQAIECYALNCDCRNCSIAQANYSFVCKMPQVIKQLLKIVGRPVFTD